MDRGFVASRDLNGVSMADDATVTLDRPPPARLPSSDDGPSVAPERSAREDDPGAQPASPPAPRGVIVKVCGAESTSSSTAKHATVDTKMIVDWDRPEPLVLEVHSPVDPIIVRGIALQATSGPRR